MANIYDIESHEPRRSVGRLIGRARTELVWDRRATLHHERLAGMLTPPNPVTAQAPAGLHARGLTTEQSYALLNQLLDNQAYMLSADDIFYVSGFLFLGLIARIWLAHPSSFGGGSETAAGAH